MLATEPLRMIEPPSFSNGKAFCTVNNVPLTLMSKSLSKCSSVILPKGTNSATPGIGEDDIDSPFGLDGLVETIKVGQFGNVSLNANDVAADFLHSLVKFFLTTACDENIGALFDEELCRS